MRQPSTRHRRGAAVLEMALVGGLLCTLLLSAFDIGRFQVIMHGIETATYEAARVGVSPGSTDDEVQSIASDVLSVVDARDYTISVHPSPLNAESEEVTVRIEISMRANLLFLPYDRVVRRQTTVRRIR